MNAFFMYKDHNIDLQQTLPSNKELLIQDLELDTLISAMAKDDEFMQEVVKKTILSSMQDIDTIYYRQNILKDCLKNPSVVRDIYDIAVQSIEDEKKVYFGFFSKYPSAILSRSIEVLQMFAEMLKKLKKISYEYSNQFESEGFTAFFSMINAELNDEYFIEIKNHLKTLRFNDGVLISAELGQGNKGIHYILRKPNNKKKGWVERIFTQNPPTYNFTISDRDESGARALSELKDRGINIIANTLAQSVDHILDFFKVLKTELAFYVGCLNLNDQLTQIGESIAFPIIKDPSEHKHSFKGLYDICLSLKTEAKVVANNLNIDDKNLIVITGANKGGKTAFLRSIGLAQLMMQSGMFVAADYFHANICSGLFTHYKKEEDAGMDSGKLDEELGRMSDIIDNIMPHSILLLNESFSSTNEMEASEIANQIIKALMEKDIKIFFVTHLYKFAHDLLDKKLKETIFLRAERLIDGRRTFRIIEGEPLQTSYGEDLYNAIFAKNSPL